MMEAPQVQDRATVWPPPSLDDDSPEYRDLSGIQPHQVPDSPKPSSRANRRRKGPKELSFPTKLHDLLTKCHTEGLTHIASWQEHGRSFIISDAKLFSTRVMPSYFRQSKFHSFQRQVSLYGFKRIGSGPDKGGYYHEMFLRDRRFLATKMKRTKVKGGKRKPHFTNREPDLYAFSYLPEIEGGTGGGPRSVTSSTTRQSSKYHKMTATMVSVSNSSNSGCYSSEDGSVASTTTANLVVGYSETNNIVIPSYSRCKVTLSTTPSRVVSRYPAMQAVATVDGCDMIQRQSLSPSLNSDDVARWAQRILNEQHQGPSGGYPPVVATTDPQVNVSALMDKTEDKPMLHGMPVVREGDLVGKAPLHNDEANHISNVLSSVAHYYDFASRDWKLKDPFP